MGNGMPDISGLRFRRIEQSYNIKCTTTYGQGTVCVTEHGRQYQTLSKTPPSNVTAERPICVYRRPCGLAQVQVGQAL